MNDPATRRSLVIGFALLACSLPLGFTLEALHAYKVDVYLGSPLRREMWTLAHAHANLLGVLCLAFAAVAERALPDASVRGRVARLLCAGAVLLPLGFLLGGVLGYEGDPSLFAVLVPIGGALLVIALLRAAFAVAGSGPRS